MSQKSQPIHPKTDQITSMTIKKHQQEGQSSISNQIQQNQQVDIQLQQLQHFPQQQQQTQQQSSLNIHQQITRGSENLNFLQGGGYQHAQSSLILQNCERQGSIPQIPTQPILSNNECIKQNSILDINQNKGNQLGLSSHSTRANIPSLRNIPSYIEKIENPQNASLVNQILSQGQQDQNMLASSLILSQIYPQNNCSNYNIASNKNVSNTINNVQYGQSQNNQAGHSLNIDGSLQNPPILQQIGFQNNNQQSHVNQTQINPPYSQITPNFSYMLTQFQPAPHIPQNLNYGFILPTASTTFQSQQQQILQQQQINQQQQLQQYQQSLSSQKTAIQHSLNFQSIQQLHQNQNLVNQQQQSQNNQVLNQAVNSFISNSQNVNQNNLKQMDQSSINQKQFQVNIDSSQSGSLQPQRTYISSNKDNNQINITFNNELDQTNKFQQDQNNQNEVKNQSQNLSTKQNLHSLYQNPFFQENILCQIGKKSDEEIQASNKISSNYNAILQDDQQNKKKQNVMQINQSLQQKNQKIKEEEDNSTSFRQLNTFINSESNQLQKSPSHSISSKKYFQENKINNTRNDKDIEKNDTKQNKIDVIIEEDNKKQIDKKDESEIISQRSQEISDECFHIFNQKQKEKQKYKMTTEISFKENSQPEKKFEQTDESFCNVSSKIGQNQRNREIQFPKEQKSYESSPKAENMLSAKKKIKISQKQIEYNFQQQENQGSEQKLVNEIVNQVYQGAHPTKKIRKSSTDQIEGMVSNKVASYAYINNDNIKSMKPSFNYFQQQWLQEQQGIINVQPSLMIQSNIQRDTVNLATQIYLSPNLDYIDQRDQNQFHQKNDNLCLAQKIKENTQKSASSIPITQPSNSFISFAQSSQITNPLDLNIEDKVEQEQSLIQNQIAFLPQNQSSRIETPAVSQIECIKNNTPNISSKESNSIYLYQSQLTKQNIPSSSLCKLNNFDEEKKHLPYKSNQIQLWDQNESQIGEQKQKSTSISLEMPNQHFEQNINDNQLTNKNDFKLNMEPADKINEFSIYSFLLNSMQPCFQTQQKMYDSLKKQQQIQDKCLSDTLHQVQTLRKEVDDMILHSTDIQGKSGLIDYMRGRLKEQCRNNPSLLQDQNGNYLDPQTSFFSKYELILKDGDFSEPLVKDKNFIIGVSLQDITTKKEVINQISIPVKLRMYTYNNPPNIFEQQYIKGELCSQIIRGNCNFRKIHIKHVTSHQKNRAMFLVVEPDIEQIFSSKQTQQQAAAVLIQTKNNNFNTSLEKNYLPLEKPSNINVKKESFNSENEDQNPGQSQIQKQLSTKSEDQKRQLQQESHLQDANAQQLQLPKQRISRKKKDNEKKNFTSSKLDIEVIDYKINPILIKPLILEQIIVKSKNNISNPKS